MVEYLEMVVAVSILIQDITLMAHMVVLPLCSQVNLAALLYLFSC